MESEGLLSAEEEAITIELIKHRLGLDVPLMVQYGRWIGVWPNNEGAFSGVLQGDLGKSVYRQTPVAEELLNRLPISAELGFLAILLSVTLALPLGTLSAIRQDTIGDYGSRTIAILFMSVPNFWVATMVIVYPSIYFGWMPELGYVPILEEPLRNLGQFLLPAFLLGMMGSGAIMRMTRTMMLEVLRQDYIRTAWSKGLRERTVIVRHAFKNAMIPVVTQIGLRIPMMIAGSVVIELVFALPGMGRLFVEALNARDYFIVSGFNLLVACTVLANNLLIDLTYAWLDPRVSYK